MAKNKNLGFITAGVTSLALGAVDQAVLQAAPHKAARNQAILSGVLAVGGGFWRLLSPKDNIGAHLADGTFAAGATLLGQSGMHYTQTSLLANNATPQGSGQGTGSATGSSASSGSASDSAASSGTASASNGTSSASSGTAGDTASNQTSADY
ncbi:MAG: hypothetical protein ACYCT0_08170 [Sulfobacillus sp.]